MKKIKRFWKGIKDEWTDFWECDEYNDSKKHLSNSNKHSIMYKNFITDCTFNLVLITTGINSFRTTRQENENVDQIINMVNLTWPPPLKTSMIGL